MHYAGMFLKSIQESVSVRESSTVTIVKKNSITFINISPILIPGYRKLRKKLFFKINV